MAHEDSHYDGRPASPTAGARGCAWWMAGAVSERRRRRIWWAACQSAINAALNAAAEVYSSSSISALRLASVLGMPSSAARLSAVASSRRILPATASLVSGGSCI